MEKFLQGIKDNKKDFVRNLMDAFAATRSKSMSTLATTAAAVDSGTHVGAHPMANETTIPATQSSIVVHDTSEMEKIEIAAGAESLIQEGDLPALDNTGRSPSLIRFSYQR
ncbi:uncharacterized protein LOC125527066 [Triticum urartu]|uniref:uncharacterized protein LOC125509285 n=1 Tax=Triticum urartu TaxID=4572 RepID=UPI002043CF15|nr:uncharacterized protein LOC125509285 [Triticum urartu]XP_048547595.1 uncharacterized protein LOC125527066 [Triticum urartu]